MVLLEELLCSRRIVVKGHIRINIDIIILNRREEAKDARAESIEVLAFGQVNIFKVQRIFRSEEKSTGTCDYVVNLLSRQLLVVGRNWLVSQSSEHLLSQERLVIALRLKPPCYLWWSHCLINTILNVSHKFPELHNLRRKWLQRFVKSYSFRIVQEIPVEFGLRFSVAVLVISLDNIDHQYLAQLQLILT